MTNMAQWDMAVDRMFRDFEEQVDDAHARLTQIIFDKIIEYSPRFTGLYATQHEIHLGNEPYRVLPGEDERQDIGQFFGMIMENRNEQVDNLSVRPLPPTIEIGNAVSYADKIENDIGITSGSPPVYWNAYHAGVMFFNAEQAVRGTVKERS